MIDTLYNAIERKSIPRAVRKVGGRLAYMQLITQDKSVPFPATPTGMGSGMLCKRPITLDRWDSSLIPPEPEFSLTFGGLGGYGCIAGVKMGKTYPLNKCMGSQWQGAQRLQMAVKNGIDWPPRR